MERIINSFLLWSNSLIPGEENIIEALFPNVWSLIAHIVAGIILLIMVIYFAWKPTKKYLEKRKKDILKDVEEAKDKRLMAEKNFEASKQELLDSKQVASQIIQNATIESEEIKQKMESSAKRKISFMEKESLENIKKQENDASLNLSKQASELALDIAEILMGKQIDKNVNEKMVEDIIKEMESSKK